MKFAEHLTAHITPEWRKQYICYEVGKTARQTINCKLFYIIFIIIDISNDDSSSC